MSNWYEHELEIDGMPDGEWAELIGTITEASVLVKINFHADPSPKTWTEWEKTNISIAKAVLDASSEDLLRQYQGNALKVRNKIESMSYEDFRRYVDPIVNMEHPSNIGHEL